MDIHRKQRYLHRCCKCVDKWLLDALFASALSDNWSISTTLEANGTQFDNIRMG